MPHRPPEPPLKDFAVEQGVVITQVVNMDHPKTLQEFKPLSQQSSRDSQRPSTAGGVQKTPRRMSFSRPLTSEGQKANSLSVVPRLPPKPIQTQQLVSDPQRIGVAVGSPTQWAANSPKRPRAETSHLARRLPRSNTDGIVPTVPEWSSEEEHSQPKVKRWRSVGGLFKRKAKAPAAIQQPASPPREARQEQQQTRSPPSKTMKQETIVEDPEAEQREQWPARKSSMTPRLRSRSFHKHRESKSCIKSTTRKPVAKFKNKGQAGPWSDFQEQVRKRGSRPELDVSIPQTEFERYSVMFSELLKKPSNTSSDGSAPPTVRHEPIQSVDTVTSIQPDEPSKPLSNRDRPMVGAIDFATLQPPPKIVDGGARSPGSISNTLGTPKNASYSLFPSVKPSPNPSVNSPQPPASAYQTPPAQPANGPDTPKGPLTPLAPVSQPAQASPAVPYPTPAQEPKKSPTFPRNHIISQHIDPMAAGEQGLGLHTGIRDQPYSHSYDRKGPSPLAKVEPRELRSPDFSPDSPVTVRSSISSTWSSRPSISHSHHRSKSSAHAVGSPGPSVNSYLDTFHTPPEEEERPPIPVTAHPGAFALSRQASLRSHPMGPAGVSPQVGYEDLHSPQVATARQMNMGGTLHKPQMLARKTSTRKNEDQVSKVKLSENPTRAASPKMVMVDNSDKPDEDVWLQRRSVWGVIEEGGRVVN